MPNMAGSIRTTHSRLPTITIRSTWVSAAFVSSMRTASPRAVVSGAHGHQDMEILSYVLEGSLAHKDSMGQDKEVLGPNEIQRMSAGTGVVHSEFNGSDTEPVHFLQIWIEPASLGTSATYEQIRFAPEEKQGEAEIAGWPARR